jgi:hypothetical protein
MIDSPTAAKGDKAADDTHAALVKDSTPASGQNPKPAAGSDGHDMVKAGTLPALSIEGHDNNQGGILAVGKDLAEGAWNEITQHPGHVLLSAAEGAAVGVAATALVAVTAPEVGVGLAIAGIGYAGYQLFEHAGGWFHDAKVVDDQKDYSAKEVAQAHDGLKSVGAGSVDVAAGIGGAVAGSYATGAIISSLKAPAGALPAETNGGTPPSNGGDTPPPPPNSTPPGDAPTQPGSAPVPPADAPAHPTPNGPAPNAPGADAPAQPTPNGPTPNAPGADAPAQPAAAGTTPGGDASAHPAAAQPSDAQPAPTSDAPAAALTPEEQALANSIKSNQGLFTSADDDNPVFGATKQDYNVRFTKVTEPTQVQTLESLKTGIPQQAEPGQWIATRLNPDGTPNIEKGIENSWPVTDKTVLKTYQATPETLQNNAFVAATRTDAPPVHMVQLTEPTTIQTKWGPMSGEAGDYLANYDYDPATGTPGENYAIVTKASFDATYQKVPQ